MNIKYENKRFDEAAIIAAYVQSFTSETLTADDNIVLNAFRRANPKYNDLDNQELGKMFSELDEDQLYGFVNNTKGVLHEMVFVEMENNDGDSITAELYEHPNHPGYDVIMTDSNTGEVYPLQLKATDNEQYVKDWIDSHDGEILVTDEIAQKLDLESTGVSNEGVTVRTEDLFSKLKDLDDSDGIWNYIPAIGSVSLAILIYSLWKSYKNEEISYERFKWLCIKSTGIKAAKFAVLATLLSLPVIGQITAVILLSNFLVSIINKK
jgi:hypothetical protein